MSWKKPPPRVKQYEGTAPLGAPARAVYASPSTDRIVCVTSHVAPRDPSVALGARIREAARGEPCTVRLDGICSFDPAKSIWSHGRWGAQLGDAGRGMATKAIDLCGAIACTDCDAVFDGQRSAPHLTREQIDLDWCMGHFRSLGVLSRKGIL